MGEFGRKKAVSVIKNGRYTKSVDTLLDLPRGLNKLVKWLKPWGKIDSTIMQLGLTTEWLFEHPYWMLTLQGLFPDSRPWAGYLNRRLDNPTFANSLVSLSLVRKGISLDVGSGMGHFMPYLDKVVGAGKVIGLDNSFWNLYFSSFGNKEASHIFCDAEKGLPFKDESLMNMFFNDCFHCFKDKKKVVVETTRVLNKEGFVSLSHVHNFKSEENFYGEPLKFVNFLRLFAKFKVYAIPEETLHKRIILESGQLSPKEIVKYKNNLFLTPSYVAYLFKKHPKFQKITLVKKFKKSLGYPTFDYPGDLWLKRS